MFDGRSNESVQLLSKSEASRRDARAPTGGDSQFDALDVRSSAESGDPSKFAADAEGLEPGGEFCGAAPAPVEEGSEAKTFQAAGCRRSESRMGLGGSIY